MVVTHINEQFDIYGCRKNGAHMLNTMPGNPGWLGNPHVLRKGATEQERNECIAKFKRDFWKLLNESREFTLAVLKLKGKRVACYCKPQECHLDVVAAFLVWIDTEDGKAWLVGQHAVTLVA